MHHRRAVPARCVEADFYWFWNAAVAGPGPDGAAMHPQFFAQFHVCCPRRIEGCLLCFHVALPYVSLRDVMLQCLGLGQNDKSRRLVARIHEPLCHA